MNDFEIVRCELIECDDHEELTKALEALDRIEKEYKDLIASYFHAKYSF